MVIGMAPKPLIFALANPTPEIMPEDVKAVRPDALIASGRFSFAICLIVACRRTQNKKPAGIAAGGFDMGAAKTLTGKSALRFAA